MLCSSRTRPSTPPSFVKFAASASGVSTGRSTSTPTSPHVPHEMYAAASGRIGTATTADAVSCEPTAVTATSGPAPIDVRDVGQQCAEALAGRDERGQDAARQSEACAMSSSSHPPPRPQQTRGRRVRLLGACLRR